MQTLLQGIGEVRVGYRFIHAPIKNETTDNARKTSCRDIGWNEVLIYLQSQFKINICGGCKTGIESDSAKLGKTEFFVGFIRLVLDVEAEGRTEIIFNHFGTKLQKSQLTGDFGAREIDIELQAQFAVAAYKQVETLGEVDTEAKIQPPLQGDVDISFGFQTKAGNAKVKTEA